MTAMPAPSSNSTDSADTTVFEFDGTPFEVAFAELDSILARLEDSRLPLSESVALYERGRALAAYCGTLLDEAELKTEMVGD